MHHNEDGKIIPRCFFYLSCPVLSVPCITVTYSGVPAIAAKVNEQMAEERECGLNKFSIQRIEFGCILHDLCKMFSSLKMLTINNEKQIDKPAFLNATLKTEDFRAGIFLKTYERKNFRVCVL